MLKFIPIAFLVVTMTSCVTPKVETISNQVAEFCGYPENVSNRKTLLWDEFVDESRAGQKCVVMLHPDYFKPVQQEKTCVSISEIQDACPEGPDWVCMAECDGKFVDRIGL